MVDHARMHGPGDLEHFDAVVIGAGQAGLAAGYWLSRADCSFVILDGVAQIGESWRCRWDSLRLFTPACFDGLPGQPFPADPGSYPTKDQMAEYLASYAERFHLPVRLGTPVLRLSRSGNRYVVATAGGAIEADSIIIATGTTGKPRVPAFAAELDSQILQLTSAEYRLPDQFRDGPTLVVGAGNSGAEIALEASRRGSVLLAGRSTGEVPGWIGCLGYRVLRTIDAQGGSPADQSPGGPGRSAGPGARSGPTSRRRPPTSTGRGYTGRTTAPGQRDPTGRSELRLVHGLRPRPRLDRHRHRPGRRNTRPPAGHRGVSNRSGLRRPPFPAVDGLPPRRRRGSRCSLYRRAPPRRAKRSGVEQFPHPYAVTCRVEPSPTAIAPQPARPGARCRL